MKSISVGIVAVALIMVGVSVMAQEVAKPWSVSATVGATYSDNRDGLETDKESNFDIYGTPRADYMFRNDQGNLTFFVAPSLKWHSNPRENAGGNAQNDVDLFGAGGLNLNYRVTPRMVVKAGDTLSYTDDPEITEGGTSVRNNSSYWLNQASAGVDAEVTPKVGAGVEGQAWTKRYTEEVVANEEDEDALDGTANVKYLMGSGLSVLGFVGMSDFENSSTTWDRGSTVWSAGAGLAKVFSPDLQGRADVGYQKAEYDAPDMDSRDSVLGRFELVLRAASDTRFRIGATHGFYMPYVRPYSVQKLTSVSGGIDHSVSKRITLGLNGQYSQSEYKSEAEAMGGDDNLAAVGASGSYRVNRNVSVGLGYNFEHWDSDVRESFDRNIVNVSVTGKL